jgi:autotransporter-associated beta strand protein
VPTQDILAGLRTEHPRLIINQFHVGGLAQPPAITLYGGDTGESLGQLRLELNARWSGPVTLAGPITGAGDGTVGSASGVGTISGSISGAQPLIKAGSGTIVLSGANTYTGNTTVRAGTLEISQPTLAMTSTVSVSNSAVLKLSFSTTNKVAALVLNGVSQAAGIYNSTTGSPYITGSGALLVGPPINLNPTNISAAFINGSLVLTWPADHTGWTLMSQTNNLSKGVSANTNDWLRLTGSTGTNQIVIPISPASPGRGGITGWFIRNADAACRRPSKIQSGKPGAIERLQTLAECRVGS